MGVLVTENPTALVSSFSLSCSCPQTDPLLLFLLYVLELWVRQVTGVSARFVVFSRASCLIISFCWTSERNKRHIMHTRSVLTSAQYNEDMVLFIWLYLRHWFKYLFFLSFTWIIIFYIINLCQHFFPSFSTTTNWNHFSFLIRLLFYLLFPTRFPWV